MVMEWTCYSRMQQLFAAHPEYRAAKAVAEQLRYPDSDPAYTMCNMGITNEESLLDFINPPTEPGLPLPRIKEIDPKLIIIAVIALILLLRR